MKTKTITINRWFGICGLFLLIIPFIMASSVRAAAPNWQLPALQCETGVTCEIRVSPQGTLYTFYRPTMTLYISKADGSTPGAPTATSTTSNTLSTHNQTIVTNGRIAFASNQDGDYEIYLMNADGSNIQQLTFNTGYDDQPVWSPDGNKILFSSDRDGDIGVFAMNADGSNPINLTPNLGSFGGRWSPDGTRIVYTSKTSSIAENIYMMNSDGSQKINLNNQTDYIDTMPFWSPDGNHIFMLSNRNAPSTTGKDVSAFDVYEMNIDGSNQTRVFGTGIGLTGIDLSPDGTKFVYGVWRLGPTIVVRDLTTGQENILVDGIQAGGAAPAWSPDGNKIIFNSNGTSIASMNMDGSGQIIILTVKSPTELSSPNWEPLIPSLSPNN